MRQNKITLYKSILVVLLLLWYTRRYSKYVGNYLDKVLLKLLEAE